MRSNRKAITWLVSRHLGAQVWIQKHNIRVDRIVSHIHPDEVFVGDIVIGTLPISIAAAICDRGARYIHLTLDLLPAQRGRELNTEEMVAARARFEEFRIERVRFKTKNGVPLCLLV